MEALTAPNPVDRTKVLAAIGAGTAILIAISSARKIRVTIDQVKAAVSSGGKFKVRATGYWPFAAKSTAEKKMEGGIHDRKGKPLYTVEDYLTGKSDHVSVSGDDAIFPYGQKLLVNWFDTTIVGRVTDTGGNFRGAKKVYRVMGEEPLDFCVASSKTPVPKQGVFATIVSGDNFEGGKRVAVEKMKGQTAVVGAYLHGTLVGLL